MRKLISSSLLYGAFLLLGMPLVAEAGLSVAPSFVYQTAVTSITTNAVLVATFSVVPGATQVDNPQLISRAAIEIQNIDTAANLWCVPVSTSPKAALSRKILPGSSWIVSIEDTVYFSSYSQVNGSVSVQSTPAKFWCITDSVIPTTATITQLY